MEDDPESKWKIREHSSSCGVVRRILTNGYVIGREMVKTGIFISSAPLVVPPLVVVSAMGFAFTVPFGVLCASYTCTSKLMSMFLPLNPPSPLMLEYYYYTEEEELENEECESCKLGLGLDDGGDGYIEPDVVEDKEDDYGVEVDGYVTDKEDNELVEDLNQGVETDIVFDSGDDYRQGGETLFAKVDEEGVDEREMEMEDGMLQREPRLSFEVAGNDQGYEGDAGEYLEGDDEEEQKNKSNAYEVNEVEDDSNVVYGDAKDVETTKSVTGVGAMDVVFGDFKDIGTNKPVTSERVDYKLERDDDVLAHEVNKVEDGYVVSESDYGVVFGDDKGVEATEPVTVREIESEKLVENGRTVGEMRHVVVLSDGNEENNYNSRVVEELDLMAREVVRDANKDERNVESAEKVLRESMGTVKNGGDEKAMYKKMASREVQENMDDEKIWEKIAAMRTIVGYKGPSQATCIAELKALYVFTGVEPPASFGGDSDLDAKLKFLMAIVGVK